MRIGIDISQTAFEGSGVGRSMTKLVEALIINDKSNSYVLFFSSLRRNVPLVFREGDNAQIKSFKIPPKALSFIWNKLHLFPIEFFIGDIDIFVSSDWTEPPTKGAKKITFIHDLTIYKFPKETDDEIIDTQKRKLSWSVKECEAFLCPSESTKKDIHELLGVPNNKIHVVRWGV